MKKHFRPKVVTANALRSGRVVYLALDGRWVGTLDEAAVAHDAIALRRLEEEAVRAAELQQITAHYAFDVAFTEGRPQPISVRERIRAEGKAG